MKIFKPGSLCGDGVDMGGFDNRVSVTTQPVGPMLIGHEKNEIRAFAHVTVLTRLCSI